MNKKKKLGRPVTGNARNNKFTVRLNDEEKNKLQKLAKKNKITISELLRNIINSELEK